MTDLSNPSQRETQLLAQVQQAIATGDFPSVFRLSQQALSEGAAHPLFYKMRGLQAEQQGRFAAAADDMKAALALAPQDAPALNVLGLCLARTGRLQEAADALNQALGLDPKFAAAAYNLGWTLETMGELAMARSAYQQVIGLEPEHVGALSSLAVINARGGDKATARELAHRALAIDADEPTAAMALAIADNADGDFRTAEQRMRRVMAQPQRLSPHARGAAAGLLADALDGQGRTTESFAEHQAENEDLRRAYETRFGPGAEETGAAYVDRLGRYFEHADAQSWRAAELSGASQVEAPCRRHVFLLGFPRSGTTLLGQVLAAHPDVSTLDERETLADAANAFLVEPETLDRLRDQHGAALDGFRQRYWRRVRELGGDPDGKVFVDKLPMHTLKLPLIARMFPQATILFAQRDPRDVVLSCFRRHFVINPTTWEFLTLQSAAAYYDAVMSLVERMREVLPIELNVQRHEALVEDFEGRSRALCALLGLDWTDAMGDFAERSRGRFIATPSAQQVAAGLSARGVGEWRRYAEHLAPVLPVLQHWADRFGYPAA